MTTLRRWRTDAMIRLRDLAEDERGDVPGWVLVANHI